MTVSDRHDATATRETSLTKQKRGANVLTWGENIGFIALSLLILTFATGIGTGKFNVFVLTKQNVVHYSYVSSVERTVLPHHLTVTTCQGSSLLQGILLSVTYQTDPN